MFACFGAKIISLTFIQNLERRILRINFHFTYRVNLKCLIRRSKSLHIESTHDFLLPPAGAPHDGQNRVLLSIWLPQYAQAWGFNSVPHWGHQSNADETFDLQFGQAA
jgi:hypothetical protein